MSSSTGGYYLPAPSHWPIVGSVGMFLMLFGFASFLHGGTSLVMIAGAAIIIVMLFGWFGTVINESLSGKYNDQVDTSFRMSMGWFIFSEVMFFAAFFGALFYVRVLVGPWLAGIRIPKSQDPDAVKRVADVLDRLAAAGFDVALEVGGDLIIRATPAAAASGEAVADGTRFDDGTGWVEQPSESGT